MKNAQLVNHLEKLLLAMLYGTTLLVLPYTVSDPINLPKMVLLVVMAGALTGILLFNRKSLETKAHKPLITIGILFISNLLILLTISRVTFSESLYGTSGRNTGVATYLSFTVVAIACALISNEKFIRKVFTSFLLIGVTLLSYGFFQYFGLEPFPYINVYQSNVFGTFGNPNFQSSFMGMLAVIGAAFVLNSALKFSHRIVFMVLVGSSLLGVYLTNSIQGFFNFAFGILFIVFFYFITTGRKFLARVTVVLSFFGALFLIASFFKFGPLADVLYKGSMAARVYYWKTAIKIAIDHPITGVGMDQYGDWLRVYRSSEQVTTNLTADSAHNIYLDVLSNGGFPLFALFCSFTLLTIFSIIRVSRRKELPSGNYIALSGLWIAFQAQSLISISQIGVAIWGWVFAGLLIGYEINTREDFVSTPEGKTKVIFETKGRKKAGVAFRPQLIIATSVGLTLGLIIALPPFFSAQHYYNAFKTSDARVIKAAASLQPYNRNSFLQVTGILMSNKFEKDALDVANEAVVHFPNCFAAWRVIADLSEKGSKAQNRAIRKLHTLDPNNPAYVLP